MKRLIALLVGIAVLMSMSLTSFAAFTDEIAVNEDGITYTAALSGDAATANAGKQTTIVAYKGDSIEVGSIQYIDQAAQDSFTFQLKDELTEDVKVVMGGEAIDKQEIGTIKFATVDPTYTVSGSISTTSADKTGMAYLYADEDVVAEAAVIAGTYAFDGVKAGSYTLVIEKAAHIDYTAAITVADADVAVANVDMFAGDTDTSDSINVSDFTAVGNNYGAVDADDDFNAEADTDGSGSINVSDFTAVGNNYGATASDYAN